MGLQPIKSSRQAAKTVCQEHQTPTSGRRKHAPWFAQVSTQSVLAMPIGSCCDPPPGSRKKAQLLSAALVMVGTQTSKPTELWKRSMLARAQFVRQHTEKHVRSTTRNVKRRGRGNVLVRSPETRTYGRTDERAHLSKRNRAPRAKRHHRTRGKWNRVGLVTRVRRTTNSYPQPLTSQRSPPLPRHLATPGSGKRSNPLGESARCIR